MNKNRWLVVDKGVHANSWYGTFVFFPCICFLSFLQAMFLLLLFLLVILEPTFDFVAIDLDYGLGMGFKKIPNFEHGFTLFYATID